MQILLVELLKDFSKAEPTFSFGELLYTVSRPKYHKNNIKNINDLREITDEDYYTAIEKAIKEVKNEK